ncbi:hypothetical protein BGZ47_011192 [Haplosporangium gracile]|nr:hypothetical protein BGZ47_011192 [Haplosporangium gracile]
MLHSAEQHEGGLQGIRLPSKNKKFYTATHQDGSVGKEIVLWEDVLVVSLDVLYLQHKAKALPFLKGPDLKAFDPVRIAAVPGTTLDVVAEQDPAQISVTPPKTPAQESPIGSPTVKRNPAYGDELAATKNYNHIDVPNPSAPGPQLFSDTPVGQFDDDSAGDEQPNTVETPRVPHMNPEDNEEPDIKGAAAQSKERNMDGEGDEDIKAKIEHSKTLPRMET